MGTLMWLVALAGAFLSGAALHEPAKVPPAVPEVRITQPGEACADTAPAGRLDCRCSTGPWFTGTCRLAR